MLGMRMKPTWHMEHAVLAKEMCSRTSYWQVQRITEEVAQGKAMPSDIGFVSLRFSKSFGAGDLVDEFTISMIIIELGFNEKGQQFQSTLTHIGVGSLARILEVLWNANTLVKL